MVITVCDVVLGQSLFPVDGLLNWDAEHYHYIKVSGYEGFRIAFFPLFPLLWRLIDADPLVMALINGAIFLSSFYVLTRRLRSSFAECLVYLTIPSLIFFFLPYTEALFFAATTILLVGLMDRKPYSIIVGLFISCLCRPAFTLLLPALIITELVCFDGVKRVPRIAGYLLATAAGTALVGLLQYRDTGEWFKFFGVQSQWGNQLQMPSFPLTSWAGDLIVRLDGAALLFGATAGVVLVLILLRQKIVEGFGRSPEFVFSLAYLGGMSLLVLFYRGGSLFSLNRFLFAVPFSIVAIHHWLRSPYRLSFRSIGFILLGMTLFWLVFGSYGHIRTLLLFLSVSLYLLLLPAARSDRPPLARWSLYVLISIGFTFQMIMLHRFLTGAWVG